MGQPGQHPTAGPGSLAPMGGSGRVLRARAGCGGAGGGWPAPCGGCFEARHWLSSFGGIQPPPAHSSALCPPVCPQRPPCSPLLQPPSSPVNHYPYWCLLSLPSSCLSIPGREQPSSLHPLPPQPHCSGHFLTCLSRDRRSPALGTILHGAALPRCFRLGGGVTPPSAPGGSPRARSLLPLDF